MTAAARQETSDAALEAMWDAHRPYLRRMLIGLARDIDLADDLLQEAYLRARNGASSYRGDNDLAWLSTIARNVFLGHIRSRRVHAEVDSDNLKDTAHYSPIGTQDHLDLISVRNALSNLDPGMRAALLMKHYCGYTYREIAEHSRCAVGTAKWRVSAAVDRLQAILGVAEEVTEMTCADLSGLRILDHLYGALTPDESHAVERHVRSCPECRQRLDAARRVLSALDALEGDLKLMQIIELDKDGVLTLYTLTSYLNTTDHPQDTFGFCYTRGGSVKYVAAQGKELTFTVGDNPNSSYPNTELCTAKLPQPVQPGEVCEFMAIYPSWKSAAVTEQEDGSWRFHWRQLTSVEDDHAFALALRLPAGPHTVSADPPPTETKVSQSTTTLLWRCMRAANEAFECEVSYRLD